MNIVMEVAQKVLKKAVELAPDAWMPDPDPLQDSRDGLVGAPVSRVDGALKVQGQARYAAEFPLDGMVYAALAYSTIPKGRIATLDTAAARAAPGVVVRAGAGGPSVTRRRASSLRATADSGT